MRTATHAVCLLATLIASHVDGPITGVHGSAESYNLGFGGFASISLHIIQFAVPPWGPELTPLPSSSSTATSTGKNQIFQLREVTSLPGRVRRSLSLPSLDDLVADTPASLCTQEAALHELGRLRLCNALAESHTRENGLCTVWMNKGLRVSGIPCSFGIRMQLGKSCR